MATRGPPPRQVPGAKTAQLGKFLLRREVGTESQQTTPPTASDPANARNPDDEALVARVRQVLARSPGNQVQLYLTMDVNHNGTVSARELHTYVQSNGVACEHQDFYRVMKPYLSENDEITYSRFSSFLQGAGSESNLDIEWGPNHQLTVSILPDQWRLKTAFQRYDEAKSGLLSKENFTAALCEASEAFSDISGNILADLLKTQNGPINVTTLPDQVMEFKQKTGKFATITKAEKNGMKLLKDEFFQDFKQLTKRVRKGDRDLDGMIDFQELKGAISSMNVEFPDEGLQVIFNNLDTEKQRSIELDNVVNYLVKSVWLYRG